MDESLGIDVGAAGCAAARATSGRAVPCPIDTAAPLPAVDDVVGTAGYLSAVAASAATGTVPARIGVSYPATLDDRARAARERAAAEAFPDPLIVARPIAAAAWYVHRASAAPTGLIAVAHADGADVEVAAVRWEDGSFALVEPAVALGGGLSVGSLDGAARLVASVVGGPGAGLAAGGLVLLVGDSPLLGELASRVAATVGVPVEVDPEAGGAAALGAALLAAGAGGRVGSGLAAASAGLGAAVAPHGAPAGPEIGGSVGAGMGQTGDTVGGAAGDAVGAGERAARRAARLRGGGGAAGEPLGSAVGGAVGAGRRFASRLGRRKPLVAAGLAGALLLGAAAVVAGGGGSAPGGSDVETAGDDGVTPPGDDGDTTSGGDGAATTGAEGRTGEPKPRPGDPAASTSTTALAGPGSGTTDPTGPAGAGGSAGPGTTAAPGTTTPGSPSPPTTSTPTTTAPPRDTAGPSISGLTSSPTAIDEGGSEFCTRPTVSQVSAAISDPSGVKGATAHWSTSGASGSVPLTLRDGRWRGSVAPGPLQALRYPDKQQVTWYVTATDGAGNTATSGGGPAITLHGC